MDTKTLSPLDIIDRKLWPTIPVPRASALDECAMNCKRFLLGSDGLYLEAKKPFGSIVKRLWRSPRKTPLPFGKVEERNDFSVVLEQRVLPIITDVMIPEAAKYAERDKEWAGFVVWDGSEFRPWLEQLSVGCAHVKFNTHGAANLPTGLSLVADIHTHGKGAPFFSRDDNASDEGRTKIAVVLGNYRTDDGRPVFDWIARYCVEGFFVGNNPGEEALDAEVEEVLYHTSCT